MNRQDNQGGKEKREQVIKLLSYIGTMSFISLGYISREDLTGLYKIIAIFFAIGAISSFIFCSIVVANMNNKQTKIEKQWIKIGGAISILSFLLGVFFIAIEVILL